ncbi:MAG TPA: class I SAM-dependent methyltransferase [Parvularculaceae bacterium]|nr:class I SAM-dependent methyltransferase [Parvularculaceae bacterium]
MASRELSSIASARLRRSHLPLVGGAQRTAYAAAQIARIAWYSGHYVVGRRFMGPLTGPGEAPYAEEFGPLDRTRLKNAFRELFRTDWRNIRNGEYKMPREARRPPSLKRLMAQSRDYLADARAVARRRQARGHSEVRFTEENDRYPRYYLQNFHFQTDGWLSERSAGRYDMQVETLFTGAAGAMRRQALPEIRRAIGGRDPASISLLDLGCGAGGFLEEVKDNWPLLNATALDLSPAYLGKVRQRLARARNVRFVEAKAEQTGLADAAFDIVTAVYLFHELPPAVRKDVAREIARLLKPGGVLIEVDTIQYGDEPGLDVLLENFPRAFHEPYYDGYCRADLGALFAGAGLVKKTETIAYLTKISAFEKAS